MNNVLERVADSLATDMVGHPASLFNQVDPAFLREILPLLAGKVLD